MRKSKFSESQIVGILKEPVKIEANLREKTAALLDRGRWTRTCAASSPRAGTVTARPRVRSVNMPSKSGVCWSGSGGRVRARRWWGLTAWALIYLYSSDGRSTSGSGPRTSRSTSTGPAADLMQVLAFQGTLTYRSLGFYCTRFGITVPDEVTGAEIAALVEAGEWPKVHDHVRADVAKTAELARRVGPSTGK